MRRFHHLPPSRGKALFLSPEFLAASEDGFAAFFEGAYALCPVFGGAGRLACLSL